MPAHRDGFDGLHGEIVLIEAHGLQHLGPIPQQLGIDDDLLERGRQASFEPPGRMIHQVTVAEDRRLQRERRLVGRLRVHDG